MSGVKNHNYPKFFRGEKRLKKAGYNVVNPARLNVPGDEWTDCLRNDINHIVQYCDGIALLDDWMLSRGARLELAIALCLEIPIISAHTLRPMKITLEKLFTVKKRGKYVARYKG